MGSCVFGTFSDMTTLERAGTWTEEQGETDGVILAGVRENLCILDSTGAQFSDQGTNTWSQTLEDMRRWNHPTRKNYMEVTPPL